MYGVSVYLRCIYIYYILLYTVHIVIVQFFICTACLLRFHILDCAKRRKGSERSAKQSSHDAVQWFIDHINFKLIKQTVEGQDVPIYHLTTDVLNSQLH